MIGKRRIEFDRLIINDDTVLVMSPATVWVNEKNVEFDPQTVLHLYLDVVALAKQADAKVVYKSKMKKTIMALREQAEHDVKDYREHFVALRDGWDLKLEKGVFTPTRNDPELAELTSVAHAMTALRRRDKPMGKMMALQSELAALKQKLLNAIDVQRQHIMIEL